MPVQAALDAGPGQLPAEPPWPEIPGDQIARRLVTVHCVGSKGAGVKAVGFNLVLIPRQSWPTWPNPMPVPTQHFDALVKAPSLGAGHYEAMHLALKTMRERRPDWAQAHIAVQVNFWELDQMIRRRGLTRAAHALGSYRNWLAKELAHLRCTTKATTWYPKRRADQPGLYRKYFGKLEVRLSQLLHSELVDASNEDLWVNLHAVGKTIKTLEERNGKAPPLLGALVYHLVRARRKKAPEIARALGLDEKQLHNALYKARPKAERSPKKRGKPRPKKAQGAIPAVRILDMAGLGTGVTGPPGSVGNASLKP